MSNIPFFYFEDFWGIFIGRFPLNDFHEHYALEITISLGNDIVINDGQQQHKLMCCLIQNNISHKYESQELQISVLLSPVSGLALFFKGKYSTNNITPLSDEWANELREDAMSLVTKTNSRTAFIETIRQRINNLCLESQLEPVSIDNRIVKLLTHIKNHSDKIHSLKQSAEYCNLSSSRLLHLFKKETGISYRRMQLWYKLVRAFKMLDSTMSLTEIAHACGFTDSAHFCKRFIETFGATPGTFQKLATLYKPEE